MRFQLNDLYIFTVPYRAFILFVASALLVGSVFRIELVNHPILRALDTEGIATTAEVVALGPVRRSNYATKGGRSRNIYYEYQTVDGLRLDGMRRVGLHVWDDLALGSVIEVRYLPDKPEIHTASIQSGYASRAMIVPIILVALGASGAGVMIWRRSPHRPGPQSP